MLFLLSRFTYAGLPAVDRLLSSYSNILNFIPTQPATSTMSARLLWLVLLLAVAVSYALAADRSRVPRSRTTSRASPPQCIVSTALGPAWQPPGSFFYIQQITLNITNAGPSIVPVPYSLAIGNPGYTGASLAFQWIIQSEAGGIISGGPFTAESQTLFLLSATTEDGWLKSHQCLDIDACVQNLVSAMFCSIFMLLPGALAHEGIDYKKFQHQCEYCMVSCSVPIAPFGFFGLRCSQPTLNHDHHLCCHIIGLRSSA